MNKKLTCLECNVAIANSANVLARHVRSSHSMEWSDYVIKHEYAGKQPTCSCGCGEAIPWRKGGFGKYAKGHDGRAPTVKLVSQAGWIINPFTSKEERITSDDDIALLQHCIDHNDPVTHDHGIKIGWEDSSQKIRVLVPAFKHLKKNVVFVIDNPSDTDYGRRLVGIKQWCNEYSYAALIMTRDMLGFNVVAGYSAIKNEKK